MEKCSLFWIKPSCLVLQNSNVENLPPHVLRLVYKEVSALAADPPEGIKVYPSEEDITELHTSIEGPGGRCRVTSNKASFFISYAFFCHLWNPFYPDIPLLSHHFLPVDVKIDFLTMILPRCHFIQHKLLPWMCYLLVKKKRGHMTVGSNAQHCNIHTWPFFMDIFSVLMV